MEKIDLKVKRRDTGKTKLKNLRNAGFIPGVFYQHGKESIPILTDYLSLRSIVFTNDTKLVNLFIDNDEPRECVLKDVTFDPVNDTITHFDLVGFISDEIMIVDVPVVLVGQAIGAKEGGIVQHTLHKLHIKCMAKDIPSHIEIDITNLKVGKAIHVKDVNIPNATIELPPESVIVSCVLPRAAVSKAAETTETPAG